MTLKFGIGRNWLAVPALAGLAAFIACGVEQEEVQPEAGPVLEQTRQELWVDIYSALGTPVTNGTVYGAANEFTPPLSCADGPGGSDLSFKWTAPQTGSYIFSTTGSQLDSVLHIYTFHNTTATDLLGCNDQENGTLNSSLVHRTLTAGTAVRIVVDSYEPPTSRNGGFQLNITERCPTAPSQCHSAPGTWNGTSCVYPYKAQGATCDDNNACTTGDVCNGSGTCGGNGIVCNSPPSQCYEAAGVCANGSCSYVPKAQGAACNDNNACTTGDVCNGSGACGGNNIACNSPPGQCYEAAGVCSNGSCSYVPKAQGAACNDGLACTTGDVCNGSGACGGSTACNSPPSGCFASTGTCTASGCQYAVSELGSCSDGMGCTRGDFCGSSGQCVSGDDICSNGTMCTPNGCAPIL